MKTTQLDRIEHKLDLIMLAMVNDSLKKESIKHYLFMYASQMNDHAAKLELDYPKETENGTSEN